MASSRVPLMAGNWKMNLDHQQATHLVQKLAWTLSDAKHDYAQVEVAVIPPYTDIRSVQTLVDGDKLSLQYGAQDLSAHDSGAYTGEISGAFLAKLGCTYVVIGHSERREFHGEDEAVVNAKVTAAYRHGLTPIMCVGEVLEIRQAGRHIEHTLAQLDGGLDGPPAEQAAEHRHRLRAGLGDRHRRGGDSGRRPGGVRSDPAPSGRALLARLAGRRPRALRRLGEGEQHRRDHGRGRRRRCSGRRCEPGPRGVRVDRALPQPRHGLSVGLS